MTELRVTVPDDVAERLASEAADRGTSPEDLASATRTQFARYGALIKQNGITAD